MSVGAVNKQTGERIPTAGMPAVDSVLSGTSTNPVQNRVVKAALDEKADTDMVAADFNAGSSYTAGNYCVQDGKLYKFKNNHSGAWSAADVDEVKITGELSSLKSGLSNLVTIVNVPISGTLAANSGEVVPIATTDLPLASKVIGLIAEVVTGSNAVMVGNIVNAGSQYIVHTYNTTSVERAYSYLLHVAVLS